MMLLRKGVKEQSGHRVLFVHESGPAERAGVVPYLDVITHVDVQQLVRSGVTAAWGQRRWQFGLRRLGSASIESDVVHQPQNTPYHFAASEGRAHCAATRCFGLLAGLGAA
jgi:hypothetical protein